ncbi:MAG: hypothetical protein UY33_C0019G0009 [Candidatus Amesbacteria bacterium GW2011_GWA1_48_9]|uniref:DUF5666 domain-containing protein n=3 Tax=Candidatus Amesiibacteriota TaxID=1752730 RepID=A0A0G1XBJ3_9BACT|nr:MAG: hypothetical protein UY33_C0019G0009 [Candidatus Amesbacteria bacterium GW2011_GWA1_48_9]
MNKNILTVILVGIMAGGGGFWAGVKYQQKKQTAFTGQFRNRQGIGTGLPGGAGNRTALRPVNGEIIAVDDKGLTVKLADGSSKIIILSDTTSFVKSGEGAKTDLEVGGKVAIFGTENPDGSVTAQNVQLNPIFRVPTGEPAQ